MVKNPPSNTGDAGSNPGGGTKIPHAVGQLSQSATTTEPTSREKPVHCAEERCIPQLGIPLHTTTVLIWHSQIKKKKAQLCSTPHNYHILIIANVWQWKFSSLLFNLSSFLL